MLRLKPSPLGYTFIPSGVIGIVDIADCANVIVRRAVPIGKARQLVTDWESGKSNPYVLTGE